MATRPILFVFPFILVAAACGGSEPAEQDTGSPTTAEAPVEDIVRTADPAERGYSGGDFPRVNELADGVYSYEQLMTLGGEQITAVSMFIVTSDGVLVADGQGNVEATQGLIDQIANVTEQPITHVVVGSPHPDHSGGNSAFPSDATFLVPPTSAAALEQSDNAPSTTEIVEGTLALNMGGREIQVLHLGRAHTAGDLLVHLPQESILFMSEVFLNRVFPLMRSAYPHEWIEVIEAAQAMDVETYVPGHGFVDSPAVLSEELEQFKRAIQNVIDGADAYYEEGASVDDAVGGANLGSLDNWTLAGSQRETAIRRAYADLSGDLGSGQ